MMAVSANGDGSLSTETMERVVVGGDLSKLTPAQRCEWYSARCAAAGLDPRTQPFQYLILNGKLVLYATKTATDQLIAAHGLSVQISDRRHLPDLGLYEVTARVTRRDGTWVEDLAAVPVHGLKGEAAANALMKAVTKAKRRTVLSACGLGMLDETETDAIPGARVIPVAPDGTMPGDSSERRREEPWTGYRVVTAEEAREFAAEARAAGISPDKAEAIVAACRADGKGTLKGMAHSDWLKAMEEVSALAADAERDSAFHDEALRASQAQP